jgi:hypothetical protein
VLLFPGQLDTSEFCLKVSVGITMLASDCCVCWRWVHSVLAALATLPVQAFDVVKRLHRTPDDKDDVAARLELYLMEKQYELDTQFVMRPFEIFRTAPNRRRSLIAAIMMREDQSL